jgi:hypothetical protein
MAQKTICDRCGTDQNVGRFTIALSCSDHARENIPASRDSDLCTPCLKEVRAALDAVFDLAKLRKRS